MIGCNLPTSKLYFEPGGIEDDYRGTLVGLGGVIDRGRWGFRWVQLPSDKARVAGGHEGKLWPVAEAMYTNTAMRTGIGVSDDETQPYAAPQTWDRAPVSALLADSPREQLSPKQLGLLANVVSDERAGVFVVGDVDLLKGRCISVVGARKVSVDGAGRARRLARELAARGVVVVSGLAEGVDTEAMTSAISAGGRVVGVIGTPLDKAYPASNRGLQERVYRDHLLVSQFPRGSRVYPSNFPARNRLMALLSDATVVIEAGDTSGSLHQAAECQRLGRWLFIARSVADDPSLRWPKRFLAYDQCRVLERTDEMLALVYGG